MAQLVEHVIGNDEVTGSIPVMGSWLLKVETDHALCFLYGQQKRGSIRRV